MSQTQHDPLREYITNIRELAVTAGDIARVEEMKAYAVSGNQHEMLDECIQEEQALLLKLRGLEQRRVRLQKELEWDGLTLQQILDRALPEQTEMLNPAFQKLEQQLGYLQSARESAERILKVRLHELEIFSQMGIPYGNDGNRKLNSAPQGQNRIHNTYV